MQHPSDPLQGGLQRRGIFEWQIRTKPKFVSNLRA